MARLHITDVSGRSWQYQLSPELVCTIGRAQDNCVALNDPRASRYHAHIKFDDGKFVILDGHATQAGIKPSANGVLIDGVPCSERALNGGERIAIGASVLLFDQREESAPRVRYDSERLGKTQIAIPAGEPLRNALRLGEAREELAGLRRKADILALLYEMSLMLSSVFDLEAIFNKATDIIFRVTPADRVVALLHQDGVPDGEREGGQHAGLRLVAARTRRPEDATATGLGVSRTVVRKVIDERIALLSQDASADPQFANAKSILSRGVRSTICAPLIAESVVHGALYADRLDPAVAFTRDDLELLGAVASQTAAVVESVRAHERLAREEVARANYSRFLPECVVREVLEHPEAFRLGGSNRIITVLFADVRGFTRIAEHAPPEQIVQMLNRYFSAMTEIIFAHGGTLDKFLGDGLLALFGAPTATPDDATNAAQAAVAMQRRLLGLGEELSAAGFPEFEIGIGLHTGEAIVGYIGSERRMEYTAIGDTVNLAARLESNARGGQILLSEATAQAVTTDRFVLRREHVLSVKNREQPVQVYELDWRAP
jgi:adenylate cyclase